MEIELGHVGKLQRMWSQHCLVLCAFTDEMMNVLSGVLRSYNAKYAH